MQAWVDDVSDLDSRFPEKYDAGQDVSVDLLIGAELVRSAAAGRARGDRCQKLFDFASELERSFPSRKGSLRAGSSAAPNLAELMARYPDRSAATTYPGEFRVIVDREKARFSSWYEMFPRSCTTDPAHTAPFAIASSGLTTLRAWVLTFSIFRRSIPSDYKGRKGKNNSFPPRRTTRAAPGRSAQQRAGTSRFIRSWEPGGFQTAAVRSSRARAGNGASISPFSVRPTIPT